MPKKGKSYKGRMTLAEISERVRYVSKRVGGQRGLSTYIINPNTGRPVSADSISKWIHGTRPIPSWFVRKLNRLYNDIWSEENLQELLFDDWWMAVYEQVAGMASTFDIEDIEAPMEYMREQLGDIDTVLTLRHGGTLFAWLDYSKISDIRKDLRVYYFAVYVRSPRSQLVGQSLRIGEIIWNEEGKRITRTSLPMAFSMIADAVNNVLSYRSESDNLALYTLIGFKPED